MDTIPREMVVHIAEFLAPRDAIIFSFSSREIYVLLQNTYFTRRKNLPPAHPDFFLPPKSLFNSLAPFHVEQCAEWENFMEIVATIAAKELAAKRCIKESL